MDCSPEWMRLVLNGLGLHWGSALERSALGKTTSGTALALDDLRSSRLLLLVQLWWSGPAQKIFELPMIMTLSSNYSRITFDIIARRMLNTLLSHIQLLKNPRMDRDAEWAHSELAKICREILQFSRNSLDFFRKPLTPAVIFTPVPLPPWFSSQLPCTCAHRQKEIILIRCS